jgi:glycosyltransferase involved in cell wall biosynthesis
VGEHRGGIDYAAPTRAPGAQAPPHRPQYALVVWTAEIGGAETVMLALANRFRELGADAEFVVIGPAGPMFDRLRSSSVAFRSLGYARGRRIVNHPRRFARAVADAGPAGALLMECSYLGACLRIGGYRGSIIAVEHGRILFPSATRRGRTWDRVSRAAGAWAADAEVGVSDLVIRLMRGLPHARRLRRIYNGVDPRVFRLRGSPARKAAADEVTVGFVGRLAEGKGLDVLIRAIEQACREIPVRLLVAGDGPQREELADLAGAVGAAAAVHFLGLIDDVPRFWWRCDIAVVPSTFVESFGMAALEAAACGTPVIATRSGALPEVVSDGITGTLVDPGNVKALSQAIVAYATDSRLRAQHGAAGHGWARERFNIEHCARAYLRLFAELDRVRGP